MSNSPSVAAGALSATDAARAAIRHLAERKLVPTPGNYRRAWSEVGGPNGGADAEQVAQAAVRLLAQRAAQGEKGFAGLTGAVREQRWSEALQSLIQIGRHPARGDWGGLLATLVAAAAVSGREWPSARRLDALAAAAREHPENDGALRAQLELLLVQWRMDPHASVRVAHERTEPDGGPDRANGGAHAADDSPTPAELRMQRDMAQLRKVDAELHEIVLALCDSFTSIADEGSWVISQVEVVREAVRDGQDRRSLAAARTLLQQASVTQHAIARSRRDAVAALRDLLPQVVEQMSSLGARSGEFGETLHAHIDALSQADSVEGIAERVRSLLSDAREMQQHVEDTRRDLSQASSRAVELESEVERLERELAQASERLMTDHLTRTANRAGLEKAFQSAMDAMRACGGALAMGLLDIDDFKKVNDALGHHAGDGALKHLAALLQSKVRSQDTVARYGGEEFVILLPGLTDTEAREFLVRVQRELTREVYLYESRQIFITFSAGATQVQPQDSMESALGRADDGMYQAKNAGKNCVAIA